MSETAKPRRPYTAPANADRCEAHARTAVKGEGARCMRRKMPGADLCSVHARKARPK